MYKMREARLGVPTSSPQMLPTKPSRIKTCGECRRLKLKCDRVFPCQSCIKRGCEGICPEGSLVSGRGSRYILANTEKLHEKIVRMAERIRELEEALRAISQEHARCLKLDVSSGPVHPLLRGDLLLIRNQLELYGPDRSQLDSILDVSYASDGSDGERSRVGREPLSRSSQESFMLTTPASFRESQFVQYSSRHNLNTAPHLLSNAPMTSCLWSPSSEGSNPFQNELPVTNGNGTTHGSYAINATPSGNHHPRSYSSSGSSRSLHNAIPASMAYNLDETRYYASDLLTQNDSRPASHFDNIWDLEGSN